MDPRHPLPDNLPRPDPVLAREVERWILNRSPEDVSGRELNRLLNVLLNEIAGKEPLHFTTAFSLMAYVCHKYRVGPSTRKALHMFRKRMETVRDGQAEDHGNLALDRAWGFRAIHGVIRDVFGRKPDPAWGSRLDPIDLPPDRPPKRSGFQALIPMLVESVDPEAWRLNGILLDDPGRIVVAQGNLPERNELFNPLFDFLRTPGILPVRVNLVDAELDEAGIAYPRGFVLEPDYLVDVTRIAEAFTADGSFPVSGVLNRFMPSLVNPAILAGHMANYFLDRLMQDPHLTLDSILPEVLSLSPLGFALLSDEEVRHLTSMARTHFQVLQHMVVSGLNDEGILPEECALEPSFYSPEFGLQGRLDILFEPGATERPNAIVELKSGSSYRPNAYGLNANHYIQTLLYDLLVKDLRPGVQALTYILYSREVSRPLRYAPVVRAKQMDALEARNEILCLEYRLGQLTDHDPKTWQIFQEWEPKAHPAIQGFHRRDLTEFSRAWTSLDEIERAYVAGFTGFISREYRIAKTGLVGSDRTRGQAALWQDNEPEKADRFAILSYLRIHEDRSRESDPVLTLRFTDRTPELANFRIGDLGILYATAGDRSVTRGQLWKCTITHLEPGSVTVRLRAPQIHHSRFTPEHWWHLEPDFLDSSFHHLTRNLFDFARAPKTTRDLLLGRRPPEPPVSVKADLSPDLTSEQQEVICRILASREYFLLWGPPGTGKTSTVLRHLVDWLFRHSGESILLLAYTNRAVDEICAALEAVVTPLNGRYFRIGGRYSTAPEFRGRLISEHLRTCKSRGEILEVLKGSRIVVGTISSLMGQPELLSLKTFDRVIIDEASQLLEPMLCGLLTRFPHVTLIGDHRQLPAVVTQGADGGILRSPGLNDLGFDLAGTSLFERLFRQAGRQGWDAQTGMLSRQGRMHRDLMAFPNRMFYDGLLETISPNQDKILSDPGTDHPWHGALANRRVTFFPDNGDPEETLTRMNRQEASIILSLFLYYRQLAERSGLPWTPDRLGIITPFKAQIALIRRLFDEAGIPPEDCTVDTVERYQGGAREIILLSTCIRKPAELPMIVSEVGSLDRKLNVALTRARERLVLVGCPAALEPHPAYRAFIESYGIDPPGPP